MPQLLYPALPPCGGARPGSPRTACEWRVTLLGMGRGALLVLLLSMGHRGKGEKLLAVMVDVLDLYDETSPSRPCFSRRVLRGSAFVAGLPSRVLRGSALVVGLFSSQPDSRAPKRAIPKPLQSSHSPKRALPRPLSS